MLDDKQLFERWNTERGKQCLKAALKAIQSGRKDWEKTLVGLPGVEDTRLGRDLRLADLRDADLTHANLAYANLYGANLIRANLYDAHLNQARLNEARLNQANLNQANLNQANLSRANLNLAVLTWANLNLADLEGANLNQANLNQANLSRANLNLANLTSANLARATLVNANLSDAILFNADLTGANLRGATLTGATLTDADLGGATTGMTVFGDVDLRNVKGLDTLRHYGPSTVGVDTFYKSRGEIPRAFLRDAGVPADFVEYALPIVRSAEAVTFYYCFISYSNQDQDFAERLYNDLQAKGVSCFYAPEHMKTGDEIRVRIDESIRDYDKLLLVLSAHSVGSEWMEHEVERALDKERNRKNLVLFPVRLDDEVMKIDVGWPTDVRTRHITDFTDWRNQDAYRKALERLVRDLKAEADKEAKGGS